MTSESVTWVDIMSAIAGSVAAVLSVVAVLVTIRVASQSSQQTQAIATGQERRDLQAYHAERKSEFREQCRSVLATANAIETMVNPRVSELLSAHEQEIPDVESLRQYLAQLSSEVNLLTAFGDSSSGMPENLKPLVVMLLEEAAWIYSDALHLAILVRSSAEYYEDLDLRSPQAVVDELLNGSAVNLEPRLMPGYDPKSITGDSPDGHASWVDAYNRREMLLLKSGIVTAQPLPDSLSEIAARSLGWVSIRRFADLASEILASWTSGGVDEFPSTLASGGKK